MYRAIVLLGPTATGKTQIAVRVAAMLDGEIISADSRQVYRRMDIGTGKDLSEYHIEGKDVPYHLIDISEPGYEYSLFEYVQDFENAISDIISRGRVPIVCGGTALYLHAVLKGYSFIKVKPDKDFYKQYEHLSDEELLNYLLSIKKPHNISKNSTRERILKALEQALQEKANTGERISVKVEGPVFGIIYPREVIKERINKRLIQRLEHQGMIEEVKQLLSEGLTFEKLDYYGLEYRFIGRYLKGEISMEELKDKLAIAIHQFSKRQMTFFRKMEKEGVKIDWLDDRLTVQEKVEYIAEVWKKNREQFDNEKKK